MSDVSVEPEGFEPEGFAQWLGYHAVLTGGAVPQAGSDRRAALEAAFREALERGYTVEDLRGASASMVEAVLPEGAFSWLPWR